MQTSSDPFSITSGGASPTASDPLLHEPQEAFRNAIESLPHGVVIYDAQCRFRYINAKGEQLYRRKAAELIGKRDDDIWPAEITRHYLPYLERTMSSGEAQNFEWTLPAELNNHTLLITYIPIRDQRGQVSQVTALTYDITERKADEEKLRASQAFGRAVLDSLTSHIAVLDQGGNIIAVNELWRQFAGANGSPPAHAVAVGANYLDVCRKSVAGGDETARAALTGIEAVLHGGQKQFSFEYPCHAPHAERWFLMHVLRPAPEVGGAIILHTDITSRKQAEEALRANEADLQTMFQFASVGIAQGDPHTARLLRVNQKFCEITGRDSAVLEQTLFWELTHPEDRAADAQLYQRAIRGEIPHYVNEKRYLRPDGSVVWVRVNATFLHTASGEVEHSIAVVEDITARKQAEEKARQSERFARRVLDNLFAFVGVLTPDGTLLEANRAPLEAAGITMEDVVGKKFWDCYWWNYDAQVQADVRLACERAVRGELSRFDVSVRMAHGQFMDIDFMIAPLRDESGRVTHLVPSAVDITERKRAEEKVRASEERYRSLFEHNIDGIFSVDLSGRFTDANPAAERISGYSLAELKNLNFTDLCAPESLPRAIEAFQATLQGVIRPLELTVKGKDGRLIDLMLHGAPVLIDGQITGIFGVGVDVTEQKRAAEALKKSERSFRQLADAMPQLVWTANPDGTVDYYNQRREEFSGFKQNVDGNWEWAPVLHPGDAEATVEAWTRAVATGESYQIEHRVQLSTGEYRWQLSRGVPALDEMGRIIKWFGTSTDIDDQKRAAEQLRRQAERQALLLEISHFILTSPEAGESLTQVVFDRVRSHLDADVCFNYRLDQETGVLNLVAHAGIPDDLLPAARQLELGQAFCGTVAQSNTPLMADAQRICTDAQGEFVHRMGVSAYACHPLQAGDGTLLGTLSFASTRRERFHAEEIDFLQTICHFVALAWEREATEAQLRQQARLLDEAHEAIFAWELDGGIIYWNQGAERLYGYSPAEAIGKDAHEFLQTRCEGGITTLHQTLLENAHWNGELEHTTREGRQMTVGGRFSLVHQADGKTLVLEADRDITERKRAEKALLFLAEAGQLLNASLDYNTTLENVTRLCVPGLGDGCTIYITDAEGATKQTAVAHRDPARVELMHKIQTQFPFDLSVSTAYTELLRSGHSSLNAYVTPDTLAQSVQDPNHLELLRKLNLQSVLIVPLMLEGRFSGGLVVFTSESGRHYDEHDRRLTEDVARRASVALERARLFGEAQQARKAAEDANRAKDEFMSVVSHELRTPLTPILGWVDILRRPVGDDIKQHALDVLERNVQAQSQLVNDILDVSRITTGKLHLDLQLNDLSKSLTEAIESVLPSASAKGIKLSVSSGNEPIIGLCDAARVRQVVWNLLSNAIKFTPEKGEIEITLRQVQSQAEIRVSDTGIGIDAEFLPFVFERFRQADSSHTRQHGGLGLGLSIVRHIVEMHGGHVSAASDGEGRGATFTVCLPLPEEPAHDEVSVAPEAPAQDVLSNVSVLIVDDEADVREMLTMLLEQRGALVRAADSTARALELLRDWLPDIMVFDITMPEINGHELLLRVRNLPVAELRQVPALVLSANATEPDRRRSLEVGFARHLDKPIHADDLVQAITEVLNQT